MKKTAKEVRREIETETKEIEDTNSIIREKKGKFDREEEDDRKPKRPRISENLEEYIPQKLEEYKPPYEKILKSKTPVKSTLQKAISCKRKLPAEKPEIR